MNIRKCTAFIVVAAFAGTAASFAFHTIRAVPIPADEGKPIAISREDVEKTLSADDAAKREAETIRRHRADVKKNPVCIVMDSLVLGDISYGASEADVRARYGTPTETETERTVRYAGKEVVSYEYADGISFDFVDGAVRCVKISDRSSLASGKGVRIGTPTGDLRRVYGEPSLVYGEDYIYFSEEDPTVGFAFEIEHGCVEEIKMGDLGL